MKNVKDLKNTYSIMAIATLLIIDLEKDMRDFPDYTHKLKESGGLFIKQLKVFEADLYFKLNGSKPTDEQRTGFYDELHKASLGVENIIQIQMNLKNDSQREYFSRDIEEVAKKYNLLD